MRNLLLAAVATIALTASAHAEDWVCKITDLGGHQNVYVFGQNTRNTFVELSYSHDGQLIAAPVGLRPVWIIQGSSIIQQSNPTWQIHTAASGATLTAKGRLLGSGICDVASKMMPPPPDETPDAAPVPPPVVVAPVVVAPVVVAPTPAPAPAAAPVTVIVSAAASAAPVTPPAPIAPVAPPVAAPIAPPVAVPPAVVEAPASDTAHWTKVYNNDKATYYIDKTSEKYDRDGTVRSETMMVDYNESHEHQVWSSIVTMRFNCHQQLVNIPDVTYYDANLGSGNMVNHETNADADWTRVTAQLPTEVRLSYHRACEGGDVGP